VISASQLKLFEPGGKTAAQIAPIQKHGLATGEGMQ